MPATAAVVIGGTPLLDGVAHAAPARPAGQVQAGLDGKAHITIAILGDSFTSGAGADKATYRTRSVVANGGPTLRVDPAMQSNTAPALQAINALALPRTDLAIETRLAAVDGATIAQLGAKTAAGTPFEHPSQLSQANGARVAVLGLGGDEMGWADWIQTIISQLPAQSAVAFNAHLTTVLAPAFAQQLIGTYQKVLATMAPGARLIVTGYPQVVPDEMPPVTGNAVDPGIATAEAQLTNQLTGFLNDAIRKAAAKVGATLAGTGKSIAYVDNANAFAGHLLLAASPAITPYAASDVRGSFHPNTLGQKLLATALTPVLKQALDQVEVAEAPVQQDLVPVPFAGRAAATIGISAAGSLRAPAGGGWAPARPPHRRATSPRHR